MPGVSIIVPSFKRIEQTVRTIRLLLSSVGWGREFHGEIIVPDSTPDDSLGSVIRKEFPEHVLYAKPPKPGIATNKNHGAGLARYPILVFCDSDMEVEPETLQNTVLALRTNPYAGAVGGRVLWRGGERDGQPDRPRPEDRMLSFGDHVFIEALYSRYIATYKQVFDDVGGYDGELFNMRGEGSDLSVRYWRAGYPLAFSGSLAVHHVHDAPDAAAVRIAHTEWGIAKDLFLLAYKYRMLDGEHPNFARTVAANFSPFGESGYVRILEGVLHHADAITAAKTILDNRPVPEGAYDFRFLEVFTDESKARECIESARIRLEPVRERIFE